MSSASTTAHCPLPTAHSSYRWALLAAVVVGQVLSSAFYLAWTALTPFIRADFDLTREQLGLIVGATAAGSALASAPFGRIGDRFGARRMVAGGLAVMGILVILSTLSPTYLILFFGIAAAGVAYGALNPTGVKALIGWFPPRELGTAIGIKQIGFPLGGALAAATLPSITLALGTWRLPVALLGVLISATAVACFAVVRDLPTARRRPGTAASRWWAPLLRRNVLLLSLVGFLYAGLQATWAGALVLYLQETFRLPVTVGAGFLAVSQFSATGGRIVLGIASDRVFGGRRCGLLVACGLVGGGLVGVLPLLSAPSPLLLGLCAVVFGLTGGSWTPLQFAALASDGEERSSGGTIGFGIGCNSAGNLFFPPLFGRIVDTLGNYGLAWTGLALVGVVGGLLTLAVRERVGSGQ